MRGTKAGRLVATLVAVAAMGASCTKAQLQGDSPAYLIIDSLLSTDGTVGVINSSVSSGQPDDAVVTFELALKDAGTAASPTEPTQVNFITVTRYHVDYIRADGRNTQGVDVPFSFDGAFSATVGKSSSPVEFTLVRPQAKAEAPLSALAAGSTVALSTIARVTFYGSDQAGRDASVTGQISVNFSGSGS